MLSGSAFANHQRNSADGSQMDLRVIERACAEQGGHYNNKLIGGVGNRVAAAGGGLTAARCAAWCASTVRGARVQLAWREQN